MLMVLGLWSTPLMAASNGGTTIAQLDVAEGHDPDHMAPGIPRDFPLPPGSHGLVVNSSLTIGTVKGVDEKQAIAFYKPYFQARQWDIRRDVEAPGFVKITACEKAGSQCVTLSASSGGMTNTPGVMRFSFPQKDTLR
ncbi:hypothetical protein A11A3_15769 [Alcanivorax hongdengensis A-11-3]|uniref:Uncharacterized protein n=1 Tax=Alcanivorax hongdengensis A-11-3 TaxID=1177179 RepID=L0W8H9_9GAMM|nr:hypothetical protein A11A3_15769 [Alcanivorax hongdengensis A-11-3]